MKRVWLVAAIIGAMVLPVGEASAGGAASLRLDDDEVFAHEKIAAVEVFFAPDRRQLDEILEDGPFFAYLSRYRQRGRYRQAPPLPADARLLGPITVRGYDRSGKWRSVEFGVDFTVPQVAPGSYRIDVCTSPCIRTIEDLYPSVFRVVAGPVEERLQERIDALELENINAVSEVRTHLLRKGRRDLRDLRSATNGRIGEQAVRIDELESVVEEVRRAASDRPFPVGVAALGFLIGAMIAGAGWFWGVKRARGADYSPRKQPISLRGEDEDSGREDRHALGA